MDGRKSKYKLWGLASKPCVQDKKEIFTSKILIFRNRRIYNKEGI